MAGVNRWNRKSAEKVWLYIDTQSKPRRVYKEKLSSQEGVRIKKGKVSKYVRKIVEGKLQWPVTYFNIKGMGANLSALLSSISAMSHASTVWAVGTRLFDNAACKRANQLQYQHTTWRL